MGPLALSGLDSTIWGSVGNRRCHKPDLVAMRLRAEKNWFFTWAAEHSISSLFRCGLFRFIKPSPAPGATGYENSTIYRITYWITSVTSSLIPIVSIAVLYGVRSMAARLVLIATFNVLLSACLISFTSAKQSEVFAITVASVSLDSSCFKS